MVFDSYTFLAFFAVFFCAYHVLAPRFRAQNVLVLIGSAIFYGWWDVRFLALLFVSAGVDYVAGLWLSPHKNLSQVWRRRVLIVSMASNLSILFAFKYLGFFVESLAVGLEAMGVHASLPALHIVLPVGISFYTFQSMSYTIDIYRKELEPERNVVTYFAFVSFFPHMVAGPIQRAHHLLGQLNESRVVTRERAREALWLLSYGYFLKEVVANPCATFADVAFSTTQPSGAMTILGTFAFGIQIYCDFWAYSMIARGCGLLLGIEFIWNFNQPYFSTSMQSFWRTWHISLSTWLRDYLYRPLGGNRKGRARTYLNLMITMLLGGLWHGAAWNFVLWGLLHGSALAIERAYVEMRGPDRKRVPSAIAWSATMFVVFFGWFLFRASSWEMIVTMLGSLTSLSWSPRASQVLATVVCLTLPVVVIELWQHRKKDLLAPLTLRPMPFALLNSGMLLLAAVMFDRLNYAFIYFQF